MDLSDLNELTGSIHAVTWKSTDLHVFKLVSSEVTSMGCMRDHVLSLIMYMTSSHLHSLTQTHIHISINVSTTAFPSTNH